MTFGCGKNENYVGRRFFQSFQKRVESFAREHVHFVNNVNFVFCGSRSKLDIFPQFPDFINAAVGGAVYFPHVQRGTVSNFTAIGTDITGSGRWTFFTIERFGQYSGNRSFTHAARSAEQKGVRHTTLADRIAQGFDNMFLTGNIFKGLRPKFAG
jgi:hypothetical protein